MIVLNGTINISDRICKISHCSQVMLLAISNPLNKMIDWLIDWFHLPASLRSDICRLCQIGNVWKVGSFSQYWFYLEKQWQKITMFFFSFFSLIFYRRGCRNIHEISDFSYKSNLLKCPSACRDRCVPWNTF